MDIRGAVFTFSQSEKIKAGLIWTSQTLSQLTTISEPERKGAEKIIMSLLAMVGHEIELGKRLVGELEWDEIQSYIDQALVMVNSGVGHEAHGHLSKALSKTTNYGQQSMTLLEEKGII